MTSKERGENSYEGRQKTKTFKQQGDSVCGNGDDNDVLSLNATPVGPEPKALFVLSSLINTIFYACLIQDTTTHFTIVPKSFYNLFWFLIERFLWDSS